MGVLQHQQQLILIVRPTLLTQLIRSASCTKHVVAQRSQDTLYIHKYVEKLRQNFAASRVVRAVDKLCWHTAATFEPHRI